VGVKQGGAGRHDVEAARKGGAGGGRCHEGGVTRTTSRERPTFAGRITGFACDWLGRQFAVDRERLDADGLPLLLLLEPATRQVLEIPTNLTQFVEVELINEAEACLAEQFYRRWCQSSGDDATIAGDECIGYRIPLFLGGKDEVENLERSNMAVYLSLMG
jgi:hypothetical protein